MIKAGEPALIMEFGAKFTMCKFAPYIRGPRRPATAKTIARMIPTTNKIQAMFVAVPAIPVKPNTAAIRPITKNVSAQLNIFISSRNLMFYI
jgi:hypothetical protein